MQKLQLVDQPVEPERVAAEQLTPGQFLAAGELTTGRPTEIRFVDTYPLDRGGRETLLVHRPVGCDWSLSASVGANHWFDLASDQELADWRAGNERAQKIEDIRRLASWLEANPDVPMPHSVNGQSSINLAGDVWNSGAEGVAEVRRIAKLMGAETSQDDEHINAVKTFGSVTFTMVAWHKDGRPAEPQPITQADIDAAKSAGGWTSAAAQAYEDGDDNGIGYSRADDGDDPTPVSGSRVPMHNGGMTEGGLVDETVGQPTPVVRYFSFGHGQTDPRTDESLLDHYVTVFAPTAEACREAMLASRFGREWAFEYIPGTRQADEWIPRWTEYEAIDAMPKTES